MDEARQEFLDIVTQVRSHLEYQKALGMRVVEAVAQKAVFPSATAVPPAMKPTTKGQDIPETPKPVAVSGVLSGVRDELGDCKRCKLCKGRKTIVFGEGDPEAALVFIGEGPGQEEDLQGRPFVGAAGQLLTDIIVKGMKLNREDVYICNIVKCRPPNNRNPEQDEIEACEPFLMKQLQAIKAENDHRPREHSRQDPAQDERRDHVPPRHSGRHTRAYRSCRRSIRRICSGTPRTRSSCGKTSRKSWPRWKKPEKDSNEGTRDEGRKDFSFFVIVIAANNRLSSILISVFTLCLT